MHASHVCTIFRAILKALGTTRRTCLVIVRVHVLRILPILAAVTDRRARKTATSYKQTCDVPVIGHVQFYFKTVCYPQRAMPRGTIVLQLLIVQQTYVRLANILTEILSCKSIAYRRLTLELPHNSCTNKYQFFQRMFFLKTCTEIKFYFSICINKVKIEMSKRIRRERRLINCNCCCDELLFSQ